MAEHDAPLWTVEDLTDRRQVISTDILPDDVLLEIFYSCLYGRTPEETDEAWRALVHVCRRWRCIVFGSPRHLNLELVCTEKTRARDRLDVWPALPLNIHCNLNDSKRSVDDIVAMLKLTDRVSKISLYYVRSSDLELLSAALQQPFPELTNVLLSSGDGRGVVPDSFLGGSAPRLKCLALFYIVFPGLLKLLLSATHLVDLHLYNIPHSAYISPAAMVTALSMLTSLEKITLIFRSPRSCPDRESRRPPPPTRYVLPVLTAFWFTGVSEYLDDLSACIDTPQLNYLYMNFFYDIVFDTPQLMQFISRTPMSRPLEKAHIVLSERNAKVNFSSYTPGFKSLTVDVSCRGIDWQLSSVEQIFTSCSPPVSMLEDVYIHEGPRPPDWNDKIENEPWVELLHPFTGVKNLYLSKEFASRIAPALQELVEGRTAEVLPTLQNIFLEGLESSGPVPEGIGHFAAARQVVGHTIGISRWDNSEKDKKM